MQIDKQLARSIVLEASNQRKSGLVRRQLSQVAFKSSMMFDRLPDYHFIQLVHLPTGLVFNLIRDNMTEEFYFQNTQEQVILKPFYKTAEEAIAYFSKIAGYKIILNNK